MTEQGLVDRTKLTSANPTSRINSPAAGCRESSRYSIARAHRYNALAHRFRNPEMFATLSERFHLIEATLGASHTKFSPF
jgi:hypothetical protein